MAPSKTFTRLIRFLGTDGRTYHGDAILPANSTDLSLVTRARVIKGDVLRGEGGYEVSDEEKEVKKLLSPLSRHQVGTVRCLGLNYKDHATETKMPFPKYPILFTKPTTSLSSTSTNIPVPFVAQSPPQVDYETELVIVIGKPCLNVTAAQAHEYILGYSVGNDVSQREWQTKRGGGQWSFSKSFDGWAPWGPGIVTAKALSEVGGSSAKEGYARDLKIWTKVNGKTMQDGNTKELIFGVADTIAFLSQGTTLMPGDLIFTGTPKGVAMGMESPAWLKDGDVVEVGLEGVGKITNKVVFEKEKSKL